VRRRLSVDCIHEFERILIIDPEECIDCFAPSEQLLTSHGVRTFAELEDRSGRVLTDEGFKPAVVKRFRRRPLVKIELAPAFEERDRYGGTRLTTRNISRFRRTVGDADARLGAGGRSEANALGVGDFVPAVRATPKRDGETYRLGVLHGLVYGDGGWNGRSARTDEHLHYVELFGERVSKYRDMFERVDYSPSKAIHPLCGQGSCVPARTSRLLPETADVSTSPASSTDGLLRMAIRSGRVRGGFGLSTITHSLGSNAPRR
jgi:hypothetical protein